MEDFSVVLEEIAKSLETDVTTEVLYTNNKLKINNPSKKPLHEIHLERIVNIKLKEPPENVDINELSFKELSKYYETKKEVIPALHKSWIPQDLVVYSYQPYHFSTSPENNAPFIKNNQNYIKMLRHLLECTFHEFWCTIIFQPAVSPALLSFLQHPVVGYEVTHLPNEFASVYETVFSYFFWVYERLITFKKSEEEYIIESYGRKYLLNTKLLSLPIIVTLGVLYKNHNKDFVSKISTMYFCDETQKRFIEKEIEERINHTKLIFEVIEMLICRDTQLDVIPISLDPRPYKFSLTWVYSVINYLLHTVATLNTLFELHKPVVDKAHEMELPSRLCFTYETIYTEIYDMLDERQELQDEPELTNMVFDQIAIGRSEFLNVYNAFVSNCLNQTLANQHNSALQDEYVELYLQLMNIALENECFICDYHMKYSVDVTNEMFANYCSLDITRTDYIMKCIESLPRVHKLSEIVKQRRTVEDSFRNHVPKKQEIAKSHKAEVNGSKEKTGPSEEEINEMIQNIMDMFPHLGDGFILKCLETYNYDSSHVINAILEENLPPHLFEIPFDLIRIPAEPEPPKPILAYRGKRPEYDDACKLLDDKKAKEEMKTYVLEGIKYGTDYDPYDDEYDDREDELPIPVYVADNGGDEITRFNPNYQQEDLASDTSYSDEEYDEEGKPISVPNGRYGNKNDFCEDPAVIRARREAGYRGRGRGGGRGGKNVNVVGKPKGQGQDKNVTRSRQVKNVNKSSKANHNRKSGAQWKRNRGMMPS